MTTLEMAILYPVVLLVILGMFQISLYWHTANAVGAAADHGLDVGRVDGGDPDAAAEAARALLAGTTRIADPEITARLDGDLLTVTVAGDSPRLVGLGAWRVRSEARGRLETFVPVDER